MSQTPKIGDILPEVGDVWRDRDPRSPNEVTVIALRGSGPFREVQIQRPSRRVWVNLFRFRRAFRLVRISHATRRGTP